MLHARQVNRPASEHAVTVLLRGDEEAIRGFQDGHGIFSEKLTLIVPGLAHVSSEVLVLSKARITVGRQHLGVNVYKDVRALYLLQELVKSMRVVASDKDAVAFAVPVFTCVDVGSPKVSMCAFLRSFMILSFISPAWTAKFRNSWG